MTSDRLCHNTVRQHQRGSRWWASPFKGNVLSQQSPIEHATQVAGKALTYMRMRSFTSAKRAMLFSIWKR